MVTHSESLSKPNQLCSTNVRKVSSLFQVSSFDEFGDMRRFTKFSLLRKCWKFLLLGWFSRLLDLINLLIMMIVPNSRSCKEGKEKRKMSMEEFEGRRMGMLTTREWCNPVRNVLHHM